VWFPSKDGTRVPMFIVHRTGLAINGERPTLLYGYGGFNVSITPHFAPSSPGAGAGGVYAVATLRGGAEFGEAWHRAGMLEKKQNVFDDFRRGLRVADRQPVHQREPTGDPGVSNGGLLVGAALTQRPDLYRAVLCGSPTWTWWATNRFRTNNPPALAGVRRCSKPEQFPFLYAYSPYQKSGRESVTPLYCSRPVTPTRGVPPLQARKMTARLQAATTSGWPVLLRYDTKAGTPAAARSGKSSRTSRSSWRSSSSSSAWSRRGERGRASVLESAEP